MHSGFRLLVLLLAIPSQAFGEDLILPASGSVLIELTSTNAAFSNTLMVSAEEAALAIGSCGIAPVDRPGARLLTTSTSRPGCRVALDSAPDTPGIQPFAAQSPLHLELCSQTTADQHCSFIWSSDPALNFDRFDHLRIETHPDRQTMTLRWEDGRDGGDMDFDDLVAIVKITPEVAFTDTDGFLVFGHRGSAHKRAPDRFTENSLAAFRRARDEGADGIEFDVVWTKDKHNIVFHDGSLSSRVCSESLFPLPVEQLTLVQVRRFCRLRNGERIMTLEEMLTQTKGWFGLYMLEIKNYDKNRSEVAQQTRAAIATVRMMDMQHQVILVSYAKRANEIIGEGQADRLIIGGWDDLDGNRLDSALAEPHLLYGTKWDNVTKDKVQLVAAAGKLLFSYTLNSVTKFSPLRRKGEQIVLTDDVATMRRFRSTNPSRTQYDVGVIPDTACPKDREEVVLYMDDEDSDNNNQRKGWIGTIKSDRNTRFVFCRVDGRSFRPVNEGTPLAGDFATLKLGEQCPSGSIEFSRFVDNENGESNESYSLGDARPNIADRDTTLVFCQFKSAPATNHADSLPDLGFSYGVFAAPEFRFGSESGFLRTDDEDTGNTDATWGGDDISRIIVEDIDSGGGRKNTIFHVWRI